MRVVLGVAVVALACAAGLAAQPATLVVLLTFVPQGDADASAVALPPSLVAQPIDLRLSDGRELTDPRVLGTGTDDDDRPFPIHSSIDVPPFVDQAIGTLTAARRIVRASSASRRLQLRLVRFHVDERNQAVGSTYSAEVQFTYVMTDAHGASLVEGAAAGTAKRYGRARSGANCAEVLSDALRDAVGTLLTDARLQAAWQSGGAPAASAGWRGID
jgi:hypothetical protein